MASKNFIYGIAAIYLGDMSTKIGYIEKGSWDWGGQKPEVTDVEAEQVPDAPVISIVNSNTQNNPTFNLIQLDYVNLHRFLGGRLVTGGWEAPSDIVRLQGRFYIEFASGQVMVIPEAAIYASMGGKLTLTEVSKIECQLEMMKPESGEKTYKIKSGFPALLRLQLLNLEGDTDANLYIESEESGARGSGSVIIPFTRCVRHNGRYYVVEEELPGMYNPYSLSINYGQVIPEPYLYDPHILYYAESEDMRLAGSFRGGEIAKERASGRDWHRLSVDSYIAADNFEIILPRTVRDYVVTVAGRNMGSSAADLVVKMLLNGAEETRTLTWNPAVQDEMTCRIEIDNESGVPAGVTLQVCNNSGVTSNVCIDYVIVREDI